MAGSSKLPGKGCTHKKYLLYIVAMERLDLLSRLKAGLHGQRDVNFKFRSFICYIFIFGKITQIFFCISVFFLVGEQ